VNSKFTGNIDAIPDAIVRLTCEPSNCPDSSNRNYGRAKNHNGRANKPACRGVSDRTDRGTSRLQRLHPPRTVCATTSSRGIVKASPNTNSLEPSGKIYWLAASGSEPVAVTC